MGFPFVYFKNWIIINAQTFNEHIRNIVDDAEDSRMNGDNVAPTVPTMLVHPKLSEVI
jgi:hypothetical protein